MRLTTTLLLLGTISLLAGDPSLTPYPDPIGKTKYSERYRLLVDLDGDGDEDMLLSGSPEEFGTMGGPWTVHLNGNGEFKAIGAVWAHPLAIAFEEDQARINNNQNIQRFARVWVYLKTSGSAGAFGYYRVGRDIVDGMASIEIYPGDGGTSLGNALYDATFKQSPIPFKIQHSTTTEDGKITWNDTKR